MYILLPGNPVDIGNMLQMVDWWNEEERYGLLRGLDHVTGLYTELPDHRQLFLPGQLDLLLADSVYCRYHDNKAKDELARRRFVDFVRRIGYRDRRESPRSANPKLDSRTTAVHHAARRGCDASLLEALFAIYERRDVNYADEFGLTHLHAAAMSGCFGVVMEFIAGGDAGRPQIDRAMPETGDTALHIALARGHDLMASSLLEHGAHPYGANLLGQVPVKMICERDYDKDEFIRRMFDVEDGFAFRWSKSCLSKLGLPFSRKWEGVLRRLRGKDRWSFCVSVTNSLM